MMPIQSVSKVATCQKKVAWWYLIGREGNFLPEPESAFPSGTVADRSTRQTKNNDLMNVENRSPIAPLRRKHAQAVERRKTWAEVLDLFCRDQWFTELLQTTALSVIRRKRLPFHLAEDLQQDVMVLIASDLKKNPAFGIQPPAGDYGKLLKVVVYRYCCKSVRGKSRNKSFETEPIRSETQHPLIDERDLVDDLIDFREAVASLNRSYRSIVKLLCDGLTVEQIARRRKCHARTIYRRIRAATKQIQEFCEHD